MARLERNLENRKWLMDRLRAEIIGPDPSGNPVDIGQDGSTFFTWEELRKAKCQINGEEILWQDSPIKRYGAGVLFPQGYTDLKQLSDEAESTPDKIEDLEPGPDFRTDEIMEEKAERSAARIRTGLDEALELDVSLANAYRPSAMGLSFLADFSKESIGIDLLPAFAIYQKRIVHVGTSEKSGNFSTRDVWFRIPASIPDKGESPCVSFLTGGLLSSKGPHYKWLPGYEGRLQITVFSRPYTRGGGEQTRLLTVALINRQERDAGRIDELCFFQSGLLVKGKSNKPWILPYPEVIRANREPDDEEEINRLLYRDHLTFGIGHGCAAEWKTGRPDLVSEIWSENMPCFEIPSISADVVDECENPLRVSMRKLAQLDPEDDGMAEVENLLKAYEKWIKDLENLNEHQPSIPNDLKETARKLIGRCHDGLKRIKDGISFLKSTSPDAEIAREAFKLMNHSMLIAQLRSSRDVRNPSWKDGKREYDKPIKNPDPSIPHEHKGYWRAFQIAFILMSIPGICLPDHDDREVVDLIWFPTGGGKTEAYLGLAAFTMFFNRLAGKKTGGVDVLMRYTLRLLTAQQFQRAALLVCAMEFLRWQPDNKDKLGDQAFRLGMWVGGDATPNTRKRAKDALRKLQRTPESENPFVILKCPWCNARFGSISDSDFGQKEGKRWSRSRGTASHVDGYKLLRKLGAGGDTVVFRCEDPGCEFSSSPMTQRPPLPVVIIDEDIYEDPPDIIIGTVDKFAMLAWKPEARVIFGINSDGKNKGGPPSLIIQDELHLISGPLGSMVGLYETLIEALCTEYDKDTPVRPKIIASTATISHAREQVRALYAREKVQLFPPSGLEAGNSFFAREARNDDGSPKPGRVYLGVMAPGHGSLQTTEARSFATLLQYPTIMPVEDGDESERDPWWTLLCFFNSLRELGSAATLLVSDARDYLRVILDRQGIPYGQIRKLHNCEELTSRIRSDRIPLAIQKLEQRFKRDGRGNVKETIDACLASSIIEVGIDIDRLSLMAIVGQPKTTSQYIQVSSRVGRSPDAPGLVVVLLSQSKPRDRSHFERFRSYHQRLYAQVEPTSVTPFSPPAIDRALHGIITASVRQLGDKKHAESPRPFPLEEDAPILQLITEIIKRRVSIVDSSEYENVMHMLQRRLNEWKAWNPREYGEFGSQPEDPPLIYPAGSPQPPAWKGHSWPTPSSLRNVDAGCEAEITRYYNEIQEES